MKMKLKDVPAGSLFLYERYTYLKTGEYQGSGLRAFRCWNLERVIKPNNEWRLKDVMISAESFVSNVRRCTCHFGIS